jgi:hypothetical protein
LRHSLCTRIVAKAKLEELIFILTKGKEIIESIGSNGLQRQSEKKQQNGGT